MQEVETVIKDAEVDVKRGRRLRERIVDHEVSQFGFVLRDRSELELDLQSKGV